MPHGAPGEAPEMVRRQQESEEKVWGKSFIVVFVGRIG